MPSPKQIYTAPANSGKTEFNLSLVSLLDHAIANHPNETAFNQRNKDGWQAMSNIEFRDKSENLALGLIELSAKRGDKLALFTDSDLSFALADMAALIAGLIDVPIYLTHSLKNMKHILQQTEARILAVSNTKLLKQIAPILADTNINCIILWQKDDDLPEQADNIKNIYSYGEIEAKGKAIKTAKPEKIAELKSEIDAQDLATIIYTSGTTGIPKGVMLSHENISSNVTASMTGLTNLGNGAKETALSFLPLTHIFARALNYGLMWKGISTYYSNPEDLREHLQEVRPTFFAAVPRVLDKAFERIIALGSSLAPLKKSLFMWSLNLAKNYKLDQKPSGIYALKLAIADKLVFSKWRDALGGRIKTIIVGGAALRPELVINFGAAKIAVIQGYGLTETSPVINYNRPNMNKAGTVGPVLADTEVKIAENGEILARGPQIMKGYYKMPEETAKVIDDEGWFHTGDIGEFDAEGYLKITGRIKNIFKLSTGKYVMPQPLEDDFEGEALIGTALVIGESEKYCSAIIFLNNETLQNQNIDIDKALENEEIMEDVRKIVRHANGKLPHWSTIKKALLLTEEPTIENGILTPKMSVKRNVVLARYSDLIKAMYADNEDKLEHARVIDI